MRQEEPQGEAAHGPTPDHPATVAGLKPVTLKLAWGLRNYRVLEVSNGTMLKPGMWLPPAYVQVLCDWPGWTVDMVDDQIIQQLMMTAIAKLPVPSLSSL